METKILKISNNIISLTISCFSEKNFKDYLFPKIKQHTTVRPTSNFLYLITDKQVENVGIWFEDFIQKVQETGEWNKTAFITENQEIIKMVSIFEKFLKGDFKVFKQTEEDIAIKWLSTVK